MSCLLLALLLVSAVIVLMTSRARPVLDGSSAACPDVHS